MIKYNQIARVLRESYQTHASINMSPYKEMNRMVEEIALDLASAFQEQDPFFNALEFLDQCSPDPELYPFSEMWEDYQNA